MIVVRSEQLSCNYTDIQIFTVIDAGTFSIYMYMTHTCTLLCKCAVWEKYRQ